MGIIWKRVDGAVCQQLWKWMAYQPINWHATPLVAVSHIFMFVMRSECCGVIGHRWNFDTPIIFAHVILKCFLGSVAGKRYPNTDLEAHWTVGAVGTCQACQGRR